jgi:aminoglycoside phosphotransferase (APT) family kinase protein
MAALASSQPIPDLEARLLEYLRRAAGSGVEYAQPPRRIYGGNEAFLYRVRLEGASAPFTGPLVLRLYRSYHDVRRAAREARVQNFVAERGFPAARVFCVERDTSLLGGAFVLMEELGGKPFLGRVAGPDASGLPKFHGLRQALGGARDLVRVPQTLASAELRLHAIEGEELLEQVRAAGEDETWFTLDGLFEAQRSFVEKASPALGRAFEWLCRERPPEPERRVICHGDMQPLNILTRDGEITGVVDWGHAIVADPAYELGRMSCAIRVLHFAAPAFLRRAVLAVQRRAADQYIRAYARERPVDRERLRYYEVLMAFLTLSWIEERHATGRNLDPDAFDSPEGRENLIALFQNRTGLDAGWS